ncbi:DNA ligase 1-like [Phalaenopsis equestris]|uniref:DNA ligase 1-like n=1 Tax=Phalaenopsis equestris TaxID=78828 RepID=UPI0009E3C055|nr:DNA ligase 1-like [Phalaenopsis equestris]
MRFSKEKMAGFNSRKRPYGLLLLLALAMAATCAVVLHQLREGRVLGLLLQERDRQLLNFQILLQKERENSKEMKRKLYDMKAKIFTFRNQKMELTDKLAEARNTVAQLKNLKTELEAALVEKQIQVDKLTDKTEEFISINLKFANLTSLLREKEAEVEEMKRSLAREDLAENSTAQNENSQSESFSISEERRGEWAEVQKKKDEVGLKAENASSMDQKEAQKVLQYNLKNQTLGFKEMNVTGGGEGDAKTSEEMENQMKENELNRTESAVKDIVRDDRIIGSSSGQNQHDLAEKPQVTEVMKNFSIDNKNTADSETGERKLPSLKEEMEGIEEVRETRGNKNPETKNDKPEDQKERDDDNSEEAGESSSSKDLQLQEINSSESIRSSQENGNGFTETLQKEAGREAKFMGQSETVENTEESETRRKNTDEKQEEPESQPEKAESFENKQNIFSSDTVERGNSNNFIEDER